MRIDKFLKVSRLIKRRTVAKEMAEKGRLTVNDQVAKAGTNVSVGDKLEIKYGQKVITVEVKALKESTKKEDAESMYEVLQES